MISQLLFNTAYSFSIYAMVALSFTFLFYPSKFFNLSHAGFISLSAYILYFLHSRFNTTIFFSAMMSCSLSFFLGLLPELIIFRKMINRKFASWSLMIASLGLYVIMQNVLSIIFGDTPISITKADPQSIFTIFKASFTLLQAISVGLCIIVFIGSTFLLNKSVLGRHIQAVSSNQAMADIIGINSNKVILISTGIGTCLGAVAGMISTLDTSLSPTFGFNLLLYGVVSLIIGGIGNLKGILAGSFLVAIAQNLAAYYLDTKWTDAITYLMLILFLVWKPLGFSGHRLKKVEV